MEYLLAWVIIGGGVGALIGHFKGRIGFGFVMGLIFGVIGWLFVAFFGGD